MNISGIAHPVATKSNAFSENLFLIFASFAYLYKWFKRTRTFQVAPSKNRILIAGLLLSIAFVLIAPGILASPATIYVPDDYSTIQEAVDAASSGDTIIVRDGTYTENVNINKDSLTIKSENGAEATIVQAANSEKPVVKVISNYVEINGFRIENATGVSGWNGGITLGGVEYSTISNNILSNNRNGIAVINSNNNTITNNTAESNVGAGIVLGSSSNNTLIDNTTVENQYGIQLENCCGTRSTNNSLRNNRAISNEWDGIYLRSADDNILDGNVARLNPFGIRILFSKNNTLINNKMSDNQYNFLVRGHFIHDIDTSNTVEGKPIYYLVDERNKQIPNDAGFVGIVNSTNITVKDLTLSHNGVGVLLAYSNSSRIENVALSNNIDGVRLLSSNNNIVSSNEVTNNGTGIELIRSEGNLVSNNVISDSYYSTGYGGVVGDGGGILLQESDNNELANNTIRSNDSDGIRLLYHSNYNSLTTNTVSGNQTGITLSLSGQNTFDGNTISQNDRGIALYLSHANTFTDNAISGNIEGIYFLVEGGSQLNVFTNNAISNNYLGMRIWRGRNNEIYLNNFTNNTENVFSSFSSLQTWHSPEQITYPYNGTTYTNYLGNYWSDYTGSDIDGDGIGDTPYSINSDNDDYPLMKPFENYIGPNGFEVFKDQNKDAGNLVPGETAITQVANIADNDDDDYQVNVNKITIENLGTAIASDIEQITVRVYDQTGLIASKTFSVNSFPIVWKPTDLVAQDEGSGRGELEVTITDGAVDGRTIKTKATIEHSEGGKSFTKSVTDGVAESIVSQNQPPNPVKFRYSPQNPKVRQWVTLDASSSKDPDGDIVLYEWDWGNNGTIDDQVTEPKITYYWNIGGTKQIRLVVTDNNGAKKEIIRDVHVDGDSFLEDIWGKIKGVFKKEPKINDEELKLIKSERGLNIYNYPYPYPSSDIDANPGSSVNLYWYDDYSLRHALDRQIGKGSRGLTYGIYILSAIEELEMLKSVWTQEYKSTAGAFFNAIIDMNIDWDSGVSGAAENLLTGLLNEPYSSGASTILLFDDIAQIGVSIAALKKLQFYNSLWWYLSQRDGGTSHKDAWESIQRPDCSAGSDYCFPAKGLFESDKEYREKLDKFESYYKHLWGVYGDALGNNGLGQFRNELKNKLRKILHSVLQRHKPELLSWQIVEAKSPVNLRVYDSRGNVTGMLEGDSNEEIPHSVYSHRTKTVVVFCPSDSYRYELEGTNEGTYGLDITSIKGGESTAAFTAYDLSTRPGMVHQYTIEKADLAAGKDGVTMKTDSDGDGTFEKSTKVGNAVTGTAKGLDVKRKFSEQGITLKFDKVTASGLTDINVLPDLPVSKPSGISFIKDFYRFETTAKFTGDVTVSLSYDSENLSSAQEQNLRLYKITEDGDVSDITTSHNPADDKITGKTDSFSYFGVGYGRELSEYAKGDVNGDGVINIKDAKLAADFALEIRILTSAQKEAADVVKPFGIIDARDVVAIAEVALGMRTGFESVHIARSPPAETSTVDLRIESKKISEGSAATVHIFSNPAITGLQVGPIGTLTFDPEVIQIKEIKGIAPYEVLASKIDNQNGKVKFMVLNSGNYSTGTRKLVEIRVETVGEEGDRSPLGLTTDMVIDLNGNELKTDITNGSITLSKSAGPIVWKESGLFPSPVDSGIATLHIEGEFDEVTLMIFTLGYPAQKVLEKTYTVNNAEVNLSGLDNGVYLYVLIVEKDDEIEKSPVKKLLILR